MKFSCLQENLSRGLNLTSRLSGISKTSLPILANILLTAQKGTLKLSTTNLEIAIETKVRAKVEEEGKITVPAQLFANYIDLLPNEPIDFTVSKNELFIKTKNQKAKIKGTSAEEFPIIPQIEKKEKYLIEDEVFRSALEKVVFAISPSETRVEISGALAMFNSPKDSLTLVGTDSYRLAEKEIPLEEPIPKEEKNIIIPLRALQELLKIIKNEKSNIEIYLAENQILFVYKDSELISRLISGQYPDYKQFIPSSPKTKIIVNREEFLRAVKTASFFVKKGINDVNLKIFSKENKLKISSLNNQIGENETTLKAEVSGENNEIVFNYRYLIDGLVNLSGEEISLEIVNDATAGLMRSIDDKSYLYLIMPMKTS